MKWDIVCLHTAQKILVCQADCSEAIRRHALNDVADKLVSVGVSKPLQLTTSTHDPAASDHHCKPQQVSAVVDGPARRAASFAACMQMLRPKLHYLDLLWTCCGFVAQLVVDMSKCWGFVVISHFNPYFINLSVTIFRLQVILLLY